MSRRRAIHVTHRDGGDQKTVQERGAAQRELACAYDAALLRVGELRGEARHLRRVFSDVARKGACQGIEQQVIGVLPYPFGYVLVRHIGGETRERCGYVVMQCRDSTLSVSSLSTFAA